MCMLNCVNFVMCYHSRGLYILALLIVKSTISRQTGTRSPSRIITAQECHQWGNILHFSHTSSSRRRFNQRLHVLQELFVALEPLICSITSVSRI